MSDVLTQQQTDDTAEVAALKTVLDAVRPLSSRGAARVLRWAIRRYARDYFPDAGQNP